MAVLSAPATRGARQRHGVCPDRHWRWAGPWRPENCHDSPHRAPPAVTRATVRPTVSTAREPGRPGALGGTAPGPGVHPCQSTARTPYGCGHPTTGPGAPDRRQAVLPGTRHPTPRGNAPRTRHHPQPTRSTSPLAHPAQPPTPPPRRQARGLRGRLAGRSRRAEQAFQRGLAALAQWVEREGAHRPVPRAHGEEIAVEGEEEPVTVKLGVWVSNTESRRDKLTANQHAALAKLGVDWAQGRFPCSSCGGPAGTRTTSIWTTRYG
ncbi:Helicase associated domain protein [Streptomyces virginiae]|uniref:helicase associated domain-containing protein n=1 Tax=Streptomyces virginiae TaxID=1961 RepID=UPI0036E38A37